MAGSGAGTNSGVRGMLVGLSAWWLAYLEEGVAEGQGHEEEDLYVEKEQAEGKVPDQVRIHLAASHGAGVDQGPVDVKCGARMKAMG